MRHRSDIDSSAGGSFSMDRMILHFIKVCILSLLLPLTATLAQTDEECLACHNDASFTMERRGKQVSIFIDAGKFSVSTHGSVGCVTCHKNYRADEIPHSKRQRPVGCLNCHEDLEDKHVFHPGLAGSLGEGKSSGNDCRDCHDPHGTPSGEGPGTSEYENRAAATCRNCHSDVFEIFDSSAHGKAVSVNLTGAPNCLTCHRQEISNFSGSMDSLRLKQEQGKMCLACHLDNPDVRARTTPSAGFIASYKRSVHGTALRGGNPRAAGCVDCHGSHAVTNATAQNSFVNSLNMAQTCGKCHENVAKEYNGSIHGVALQTGVKDSPTCTDCHGEHEILSAADPRSRVEALNVSSQVCSPCHSSVRLSEKYGLSSDRFSTFADSYHGLANKAGSVEVANCASCHGVHNIKPSSDSTSMIHKANLVQTCGKCHPGANQRFIIGSVHISRDPADEPLLYWISTLYIILILMTVGGMGIHNMIDFVKKSKRRLLIRRGAETEHFSSHRLYLRMTLNERVQHGTLLISFTALVITGFALRYPDAWWVVSIRNISPMMFDIRNIVHRVAGVVLMGVSLYHLCYILFVPRGKRLIRDLLPELKDVTDIFRSVKYNLGMSKEKPQFKRFGYIEKAEYWALIWGTVIMGATGIILWFDNTFMGLLTKMGWDVAREIHFYEAWLATLAIIVWHFYFVIFNPDVYPLNVAFWKGTLTEQEMRHEHPAELEEIIREEESVKRKKAESGNEKNNTADHKDQNSAVKNSDGDDTTKDRGNI